MPVPGFGGFNQTKASQPFPGGGGRDSRAANTMNSRFHPMARMPQVGGGMEGPPRQALNMPQQMPQQMARPTPAMPAQAGMTAPTQRMAGVPPRPSPAGIPAEVRGARPAGGVNPAILQQMAAQRQARPAGGVAALGNALARPPVV